METPRQPVLDCLAVWTSTFKPKTLSDFIDEVNRESVSMRQVWRFENGLRVCLLLENGEPCRFSDMGKKASVMDYYGENKGRFTFDGKVYWTIVGLAVEPRTQHVYFDLQRDGA